jgi:hypothetical protein
VTDHVKLGYAIAGGAAVNIPIRHMVVAGQTQEAGKTTTLEALIARSGRPAIAFVTKRGEQSFANARRIEPYFRERADWQFVASILEATMREKMKFERNWIIRASKGAKTLRDVQANVRRELKTARGISEGVYTTLDAYLELVVPRIDQVKWAPALELGAGINVVDLSDDRTFPAELQSLVMRSCLEAVYQHFEGVITIIPEAWEFIPQGRGSPVKLAAIELIRKGAGLKNYVWLDSQDIGGVDKEILRQCPVWLLGVQREANEIKRVLANIPDSTAKPRPSAIATLERGQFFACYSTHAIKTYVQPAWMHDVDAQQVTRGDLNPDLVKRPRPPPPAPAPPPDLKKPVRPYEQPPRDEDDLMTSEALKKLDHIAELLEQLVGQPPARAKAAAAPPTGQVDFDEEQMFERFRDRLLKDPRVLEVLATQREILVAVSVEKLQIDGKSLRGRLAQLIAKGFFDNVTNANQAFEELKRIGVSIAKPSVYKECDNLAALGFLTKENGGYQAVPDMKVNVVR